jgi:hypothetical protein
MPSLTPVQIKTAPGLFGGAAFDANVTPGNTVAIMAFSFSSSDVVISSNSPTYDSAPAVSPVLAMTGQSPYNGGTVWFATWLIPDVEFAGTGFGLTVVNGSLNSNVGVIGMELPGLGASPVLDDASPNPAIGTGASGTTVASGPTGDLTSPPEIILAQAVGFGGVLAGAGAPWNETTFGDDLIMGAWQAAAAAGGSFNYSQSMGSSVPWAVGAVAITAAQASALSIGDEDVPWHRRRG